MLEVTVNKEMLNIVPGDTFEEVPAPMIPTILKIEV